MRNRVFTFLVCITTSVLILAGIFSYHLAGHVYSKELEERLLTAAGLVSSRISNDIAKDTDVDFTSYTDFFESGNINARRLRLTIVDENGNVAAESSVDRETMENHGNRKEIREALLYGTGRDERYSSSTGTSYMYLAIYNPEAKAVVRVSVLMSEIAQIRRSIINYVFIGILLFFLIVFAASYKFSAMITRPVSEIVLKSRLLAFGEYSVRVEKKNVKLTEELSELASTFNNMAETLENVVSELKSSNKIMDTILNSMNEGLVALDTNLNIILINKSAMRIFNLNEDIQYKGTGFIKHVRTNKLIEFIELSCSANRPAVSEIETDSTVRNILKVWSVPFNSTELVNGIILTIQDITEIRKLEQVRTEFVSNVTHELKTPLTSIRGFIETLRTGRIEDEHVRDSFLEIIDIESERLYLLINDILQLSEIESKRSESFKASCNIREITDDVFRMLSIESKNYKVVLENKTAENVTFHANCERIKQLLINLVSNSIKYNVPEGRVIVNAYVREGVFELTVEDTGIGIESTHIDRIFERFYRVDKGRSRKTGGTGLGLAIVKHIVNLYSGNIKVSSTPGKGTLFIIQLPESN